MEELFLFFTKQNARSWRKSERNYKIDVKHKISGKKSFIFDGVVCLHGA